LWLHATEQGASGLLLQRLSQDAGAKRSEGKSEAEIDDAWRRVQLLGDTLRPEEIQALSDRDILRRLFAEDDVRLFEPAPVFFRCRCSRERVTSMLRALGAEEVRSVLAEQGKVEVRCDFCNRAYIFDSVDTEHILSSLRSSGAPDTRH
jgi:molecular chaperone Hsp33